MATFNDWHRLNLGRESREATTPTTEFSKSKSIYQIDKIQEQHMEKAKQSGDQAKVKEASRFCIALEREKNFLRHSK